MVRQNANCTYLPNLKADASSHENSSVSAKWQSQNCHVLLKYAGLRHNKPAIGTRVVKLTRHWGLWVAALRVFLVTDTF